MKPSSKSRVRLLACVGILMAASAGLSGYALADTVAGTLPTGPLPFALGVNPVSHLIYVANSGDGLKPGTVTVLNGVTHASTTLAAGLSPTAVAVNAVTNQAYVANSGDATVTVITGSARSTATVQVGMTPRAVAVNSVTNKIYVVNRGDGTNPGSVTVIDGATHATVAVNVGSAPFGIAVNSVTNKIYVSNSGDFPGSLTVIDGATNTTTTVAAGFAPNGVAVNPATNRIYVANFGDRTHAGSVTVIDGVTNAAVTLPAGSGPNGVAVNSATNQIYVTDFGDGKNPSFVQVIDGATQAMVAVPVGADPDAVAADPATGQIYVANYNSGNVTVIDGATMATSAVKTGLGPHALAIDAAAGQIYVGNLFGSTVTVIAGSPPFDGTVTAFRGEAVPGQSAHPTPIYGGFGPPQVGAFGGIIQSGKSSQAAIFDPNGRALLQVGKPAPGLSGSVIATLGQPSGDAALATLVPGHGTGITSQTNVALVTGLSTGMPKIAARTGSNSGLPPGVAIKSFLAVDGNGTCTFFLATLTGPGFNPPANVALCAVLPGGNVNLLVHRGAPVDGHTVSVMTTLVGSSGTLAGGRWRAGDAAFGVRLTLDDGSQRIYSIPASATLGSTADWTLLAQTGPTAIPTISGASITSFGLPGFGPKAFAVLAQLAAGPGNPVTVADNVALLTGASGVMPSVLARKGQAITADADGHPLSGVTVNAFTDPLVGGDAQVAFTVTASGVPAKAVAQLARPALGYSPNGTDWHLLANVGALAPGGGHWTGFTSLAVSERAPGGALFVGTLQVSVPDGIAPASNVGLWGLDSSGALRLLLRTFDAVSVAGRRETVRSFTALTPALGSVGAANGYDQHGNVEALTTFIDGPPALLQIAVP